MAVIVAGVILSRFLPRIPVLSDIILAPPNVDALSEGPRLRPDVLDEAAVLIGKTGKAVTMLRPAGKAEVDGRLLEVVSEGGFIAEGAPIEIIHASKQRVVVRAATLA
jgi:membrane-bound serine protease (ClpP class)